MSSAAPKFDAPDKTQPSRLGSDLELFSKDLRELGCGRVLGRYVLLRLLATGGMAEVYSARARGAHGFERKVAIKKILPQQSHNSRFISMLVDEARITVSLAHPNIAHTHELAVDDEDNYFIVMEYVDGPPLSRVISRLRERGRTMPIDLAVHVISEVAKGLDHAHKQTDGNGASLSIVHRDVSPQNVLLSYQGDVKLIDFGIARAEGRAARTGQGVIKGKLKYLAPEIACGTEPDHRADVYCCGLVLFEMLTGEPMFSPGSDWEAIDLAREARVRSPRSINPEVPPELDEIVMRALKRDRAARYQSAKELHSDLRMFGNQKYPTFLESELSDFMEGLFAQEISEQRRIDAVAEVLARDAEADMTERGVKSSLVSLARAEGDEDETQFPREYSLVTSLGPSASMRQSSDLLALELQFAELQGSISEDSSGLIIGFPENESELPIRRLASSTDFHTEITELGSSEEDSASGFIAMQETIPPQQQSVGASFDVDVPTSLAPQTDTGVATDPRTPSRPRDDSALTHFVERPRLQAAGELGPDSDSALTSLVRPRSDAELDAELAASAEPTSLSSSPFAVPSPPPVHDSESDAAPTSLSSSPFVVPAAAMAVVEDEEEEASASAYTVRPSPPSQPSPSAPPPLPPMSLVPPPFLPVPPPPPLSADIDPLEVSKPPAPPPAFPPPPTRSISVERSPLRRKKPSPQWSYVALVLTSFAVGGSSIALALSMETKVENAPVVIVAKASRRGSADTSSHTAARAMSVVQACPAPQMSMAPAMSMASSTAAAQDHDGDDPDGTDSGKGKGHKISLRVKSSMPSTIYLDGKKQGKTPKTLSMKTGVHEIMLESPDGETRTFSKYFGRGKNPPISVTW